MDDKYRSRRWILANRILGFSWTFSLIVLIIGLAVSKDDLGSIITGVLAFLGTVHSLIYGAYVANRAYTNGKGNGE